MYLSEDTACCALTEIAELQDHDSAKDAMLGFCNKALVHNRYTGKVKSNIGGFYIFAGVERVTDRKIITWKNGQEDPEYNANYDRDYDDDYRYPVKIGYASEFASFIRRNGLGNLKASPPRPNTLNHPKHIVRCWIWSPDENAIMRWFQRNNR